MQYEGEYYTQIKKVYKNNCSHFFFYSGILCIILYTSMKRPSFKYFQKVRSWVKKCSHVSRFSTVLLGLAILLLAHVFERFRKETKNISVELTTVICACWKFELKFQGDIHKHKPHDLHGLDIWNFSKLIFGRVRNWLQALNNFYRTQKVW